MSDSPRSTAVPWCTEPVKALLLTLAQAADEVRRGHGLALFLLGAFRAIFASKPLAEPLHRILADDEDFQKLSLQRLRRLATEFEDVLLATFQFLLTEQLREVLGRGRVMRRMQRRQRRAVLRDFIHEIPLDVDPDDQLIEGLLPMAPGEIATRLLAAARDPSLGGVLHRETVRDRIKRGRKLIRRFVANEAEAEAGFRKRLLAWVIYSSV